MPKSMTAFARHSFSLKDNQYAIEIQSLNKKHLDLNLYLPRELSSLDPEIRSLLKGLVHRGQVVLKIVKEASGGQISPTVDEESLRVLQKSLIKLCKSLNLSQEQITLPLLIDLLKYYGNESKVSAEVDFEKIKEALKIVFSKLIKMKILEGEALKSDILKRLALASSFLNNLEASVKNEPKLFKEKLLERINHLQSIHSIDEDRLAKEVVLFSDKVDVSEEIARLKSHFDQMKTKLDDSAACEGKVLDFLALEMNREINTILAKTSLLEAKNLALSMKSELEKIREQLQNIE